MRIGVLTTSYPREPGDPAGNFVAGLNRYLAGLGHQIEVVAAGDGDLPRAPGAVTRVDSPLFYRGGAPDALSYQTAGEAVRFSLALLRACRDRLADCQVLVSHWLVPCGVLAALCRRGRPHLMIAHSSDVHLLRRLRGEALVRWLSRRGELVYSAPSLGVPGAPGRVVPMGIDAGAFAPAAPGEGVAERSAIRARLGLESNRPTVLFLGRLVPVKGVALLLAVLAGWPDGPDLLIAGDGPLREDLVRRAAPLGKRVRFFGEVRGALRRELLLAADLLCLPSLRLPDGRTEGAPTVVLEALAAGCPVVAGDVGGVAAQIGGAGIVFPPGSPDGLFAALSAGLAPGFADKVRPLALWQGMRHDWSVVGPAILGVGPETTTGTGAGGLGALLGAGDGTKSA